LTGRVTAAHRLGLEQRRVLEELTRGQSLTRARLAELTGWSRNTVGTRLDELERLGWVTSAEVGSSGGRPATVFSLRHERALIFIAAFGATHVQWGLTDLLGEVLATEDQQFSIGSGPQTAVDSAHLAMARLAKAAGHPLSAVGSVVVGLPSPIHATTRRPINPSVMPGWVDFDVLSAFETAFGLPVSIENDAKLMALGSQLSFFPQVENLVFIKVATGIGAGIISGGVLQRGILGMAGEIGHLPIARGDRQCDCGNSGCVARYAALGGVLHSLRDAGVEAAGIDDIVSLATNGHPETVRVLRQAGRELGEVVAAVLAIVNPEVVILGGTLTSVGNDLLAGMRESLYALAHPSLTSGLRTLVVLEHDRIAMRGAAGIGLEEYIAVSSEGRPTQKKLAATADFVA
jgi:predicted NBD/HSP70 family sugar kinase